MPALSIMDIFAPLRYIGVHYLVITFVIKIANLLKDTDTDRVAVYLIGELIWTVFVCSY